MKNNSYLVKFLLMIIDLETGEELHSEEVGVTFIERESKYLRGLTPLSYYDEDNIQYWIRSNTIYHLETEEKPCSTIFFTVKQLERFEELVLKLRDKKNKIKYDTCHIETFQGDALEVKEKVRAIRNNKSSVIWLGELV